MIARQQPEITGTCSKISESQTVQSERSHTQGE